MSNSNVIKCVHCGKVYFNADQNICPFCKKKSYDLPDIFRDIFPDIFDNNNLKKE